MQVEIARPEQIDREHNHLYIGNWSRGDAHWFSGTRWQSGSYRFFSLSAREAIRNECVSIYQVAMPTLLDCVEIRPKDSTDSGSDAFRLDRVKQGSIRYGSAPRFLNVFEKGSIIIIGQLRPSQRCTGKSWRRRAATSSENKIQCNRSVV